MEKVKIRLNTNHIIYEDENYIAINKQSHWPVHQTLDKSRDNLTSALTSFLKNRGDDIVPVLAHRLDVMTSGIVMFSKTKAGNKVLSDIMQNRTATKIYVAICEGHPSCDQGILKDYLKIQKVGPRKIERQVKVQNGGTVAITEYVVTNKLKNYSQIEFKLITGRKHQIRAQSSIAGFPIVGDTLYGAKNIEGVDGQLLHAKKFEFFDPMQNKNIVIEAPLPERFVTFQKIINGEKFEAKKFRYVIFNKPFNCLCQFTSPNKDEVTLSNFNLPKDIYPIGRLDKDSEGLLLLTNDGHTKDILGNEKFNKLKTYWVQVDKIPSDEALEHLRRGVKLKDYTSKRANVRRLTENEIATIKDRIPPVRFRKNIPTSWIEIQISEGKNRQVRHMTAAVGHPTLRLIRVKINDIELKNLAPGEFVEVSSFRS